MFLESSLGAPSYEALEMCCQHLCHLQIEVKLFEEGDTH